MMINTIQKSQFKSINFSHLPPNSFILEVDEDYGVFKAGDLAVFVPIEVNHDSPKDGSILIVNDKIGIFTFSFLVGCQLRKLDDNTPIFTWRNRNSKHYQINGLFIGVLNLKIMRG